MLKTMRFVVRNRRVAARKRPARQDLPQYSERAVFEAVVNAVVHRDYAVRGSKIRLFMFDDRLELYSPGGLCNSMTTEDLRTSQFTRNELLASRLGQCPVGEVPGAGDDTSSNGGARASPSSRTKRFRCPDRSPSSS